MIVEVGKQWYLLRKICARDREGERHEEIGPGSMRVRLLCTSSGLATTQPFVVDVGFRFRGHETMKPQCEVGSDIYVPDLKAQSVFDYTPSQTCLQAHLSSTLDHQICEDFTALDVVVGLNMCLVRDKACVSAVYVQPEDDIFEGGEAIFVVIRTRRSLPGGMDSSFDFVILSD